MVFSCLHDRGRWDPDKEMNGGNEPPVARRKQILCCTEACPCLPDFHATLVDRKERDERPVLTVNGSGEDDASFLGKE